MSNKTYREIGDESQQEPKNRQPTVLLVLMIYFDMVIKENKSRWGHLTSLWYHVLEHSRDNETGKFSFC